jgi:hypothetical protein
MFRKNTNIWSLVFSFVLITLFSGTVQPAHTADTPKTPVPPPVPIKKLEGELTTIEKELTDLEKQIDTMLEDLVDPKLTSLSIFFASQQLKGKVPASLVLKLDGDPLASVKFEETDRLVLVRGGALEVHSGIVDPASHTFTVECILVSSTPGQESVSTGKTSFKFDARRAAANFLEITLSEDLTKKPAGFRMNARSWSKEP